ncbi:hypothetical protein Q9314_25150 (plasmid) [Shinella sumterensis]|nr:hypothetical protein Q9314_25150 [Shinella sumterensis]
MDHIVVAAMLNPHAIAGEELGKFLAFVAKRIETSRYDIGGGQTAEVAGKHG